MKHLCTCSILLALLAGCGVLSGGPDPVAQVDQVNLMVPVQAAVSLSGQGGPDGLLAAVLFTRDDHPKPLAVSGTLTLMMFDGRVNVEQITSSKPAHQWSFTASELSRMLGTNEYGMYTYRLVLPWGPTPPRNTIITLVAKYIPPQGPPVYSAPINVPIKAM